MTSVMNDGPFEITPEMAENDKYDNTIADMEFGEQALISDKLDKQAAPPVWVEEMWPKDHDGRPVARTPEAVYPSPAYPSAH